MSDRNLPALAGPLVGLVVLGGLVSGISEKCSTPERVLTKAEFVRKASGEGAHFEITFNFVKTLGFFAVVAVILCFAAPHIFKYLKCRMLVLKDRYYSLIKDNRKLELENERLKGENSALDKQNDQFRSEVRALEEKVRKLETPPSAAIDKAFKQITGGEG